MLQLIIYSSFLIAFSWAVECSAGNKVEGDTCVPCARGEYDAGNNTCVLCPGGSITASEGMARCDQCPIQTHSSDNRTVCLPCTNGHYADKPGNEECIPCAEGYFTDKIGALQCDPCPVGQYQDKAGFDYCYPCPKGTFANEEGTAECTKCPVNTYLDLESQTTCKPCPAGSYQDEEGQTSCKPCSVGSYGNIPGEGCKACAAGTFTNSTGQTKCAGCAKGYYNLHEGQTECIACPLGQFQNLVGQSRCEPCPPRTYGDREGLDYCEFCPAGSYSVGSGNSECTLCPVGHYTDREAQEQCIPCPRGFYQDQEGQSQCKPCSAGSAAPAEGSAKCDACPAGKYAAKDKAVTCELCGRGYFQPEESSTQCKSCLWGKITKIYGSKSESDCYWEQCPPGFRYVGGDEMCVKCEPGTYTDEINSPSCKKCALGTYTEFERASFCDKCPETHFTYSTGSDSKSDCQGPHLVGYTMKNFGGRRIAVYDSIDELKEVIHSVRVFKGDWTVYSHAGGKGYNRFISEGGEIPDLDAVMSNNGAISARTKINDIFCYTEKGSLYRGTRDFTVSGKSCQMWNSTHPHEHTDGLKEKLNYCRNPGNSKDKPWCYTNDPNTRWEYCDVPACVWNRDCVSGDGTKYRGKVNHARGGSRCQNWDSDFPHPHGYHSSGYSSKGIGNHNYCRNPSGEWRAWCYTTHLFVRWDYCDIPYCSKDRYSYYDQRQ